MSQRVVVDPVTRIEGHLRVEAQVDGGQVTDAWSSGTMWRGIEDILKGRDPREAWLFAQRICGVCTTVHALASVRAVEDALDIQPPLAASLLRDLIAICQYVQDHTIHFYHLQAFDWVDVVAALKADPSKTASIQASLSDYPKSGVAYFQGVQEKLQAFVNGGNLGPFTNGYWGHPAYKLPPEVDLLAVSHYLDALEFQRDFIRIQAMLGGKNPHPQTYLVGGMAHPIDLTSESALNDQALDELETLFQNGLDFVTQALLPDIAAIASYYLDWGAIGGGVGNYLAFGDFSSTGTPPRGGSANNASLFLPSGVIYNRDLSKIEPVDPMKIAEEVARSYYTYSAGDQKALQPLDGETNPNYTGPTPPYASLDVDNDYSWLKSPRYDGAVMEVGPLARMLVAYADGRSEVTSLINSALGQLNVGADALFSTLGRVLARGVETVVIAQHASTVLNQLRNEIASGNTKTFDDSKWDPGTWPSSAKGFGFHAGPRGALSHWVDIADGKISNYQVIAPTTWNAGPRDASGQPGPYEASLVGTPVADPTQPLEILRTIHSFDPCIACAVHILDAGGDEVLEVQVQ
jgi:Ni,Fe-hydrogenase I large subunit